jgi:hypothetical protein
MEKGVTSERESFSKVRTCREFKFLRIRHAVLLAFSVTIMKNALVEDTEEHHPE